MNFMTAKKQSSIQQQIGGQLKAAREKLNLTLKDAETISSVPYTNISIIEAGKVNLTLNKLEALAAAYNLEVVIKFKKAKN